MSSEKLCFNFYASYYDCSTQKLLFLSFIDLCMDKKIHNYLVMIDLNQLVMYMTHHANYKTTLETQCVVQ